MLVVVQIATFDGPLCFLFSQSLALGSGGNPLAKVVQKQSSQILLLTPAFSSRSSAYFTFLNSGTSLSEPTFLARASSIAVSRETTRQDKYMNYIWKLELDTGDVTKTWQCFLSAIAKGPPVPSGRWGLVALC
jgi:hypothetical protein